MEAISQLEHEYFLLKCGVGDYRACIRWAMDRLLHDQEGEDLNIVLLAAATKESEASPLIPRIIETYCGAIALDAELAAGKFIASLRDAYLQGKETIKSIDAKLNRLYCRLNYPNWLVMLSRNCEYATDIPAFQEPFEKEFAYIADLWATVSSRQEFERNYSREISNQHDFKFD
jgi:hypothetical protein